ncbi:MAG: MBL fold metallo-hydrolase [Gemmatimonadota bacterium]
MQVLGSGGPRAGSNRASSSYLVWIDGRARVMVDAGGGSFVRFGESGARLEDLSLLAISHVHPDHTSGLPGLLWLSDMARAQTLPLVGPSGAGDFPSIASFLTRLFDPSRGAFPALSGTVGGPGRGVLIELTSIDVGSGGPTVVLEQPDLVVEALPVPHGNVPALAYRVETRGLSVVFSSDQNGSDDRFVEFAGGATALVMHLAVPSSASGLALQLHATPETVGRIASTAAVDQLILSHLFGEAGTGQLEEAVEVVRSAYDGVVHVSDDLACYPLI